jgi:hypothetical protein
MKICTRTSVFQLMVYICIRPTAFTSRYYFPMFSFKWLNADWKVFNTHKRLKAKHSLGNSVGLHEADEIWKLIYLPVVIRTKWQSGIPPSNLQNEGNGPIVKRQLKFAWHYMGPFHGADSHFVNNNGESLPNCLPHTDETFLMERTSCNLTPHRHCLKSIQTQEMSSNNALCSIRKHYIRSNALLLQTGTLYHKLVQ